MKTIYIKALSEQTILKDLHGLFPEWDGKSELSSKELVGFYIGQIEESSYAALLVPEDFEYPFQSELHKPKEPMHQFTGFPVSGREVPDDKENLARSLVRQDITFGQQLVFEYLVGNKLLDTREEDSLQQLFKFQAVKALLEVGAIAAALYILKDMEIDAIFTEDRKQFFIKKLEIYLNELS